VKKSELQKRERSDLGKNKKVVLVREMILERAKKAGKKEESDLQKTKISDFSKVRKLKASCVLSYKTAWQGGGAPVASPGPWVKRHLKWDS